MDTLFRIKNYGVILLAAGASARLGRPKQMLEYKGRSLLRHTLSVIQETGQSPVIVVLGAFASSLIHELDNEKLTIAHNEGWQEGIASSIRVGIQTLQKNFPDCDGAFILLADQPYISAALLHQLVNLQAASGVPVVASNYEGINGPPALFHKSLFPELLALKGDTGAGRILKAQGETLQTIPFLLGKYDIDTEEDYASLVHNKPI